MTNNRNNLSDYDVNRIARKVYDNYYGDPGLRSIRRDQRREASEVARQVGRDSEMRASVNGIDRLIGLGVIVGIVVIATILESLGIITL